MQAQTAANCDALLAFLEDVQAGKGTGIASSAFLARLNPVEAGLDADASLEPSQLQRLVSVLCSWLRDHEDFPDISCICSILRILAKLFSQDSTVENIAVQKGLLSTATNLLGTHSLDASLVRACLEVVATLNVAESADSIITRLGTVKLIIGLLEKHKGNISVIEDAITTLALMARRTRHRRTIAQTGGIAALIEVLKRRVDQPSLVVAVCRFLGNYAVKEECCLTVLQSGGVDALMAAFNHSAPQGVWGLAHTDVRAAVAHALWTCSADCRDVQQALFASGWLASLAAVLQAHAEHEGLHEAALGIVRGLSKNAAYREDIVELGFVPATIQAMRTFRSSSSLLKEACGLFGNLASDAEIRVQLGECGVIEEVFAALESCHVHNDRKVAKLALGALSNLANSDANRAVLARISSVPVLLDAARKFMGNENILEYAIGAVSHLAVHDACNQQLVNAGAVEALLLFIGEHQEDLQVVAKSLIALRRLLKHSQSGTGVKPDPAVVSQITRAGLPDGARGVHLLVDAMKSHIYDEVIVKETALLLGSLVVIPGVVPVVMASAVPLCMKALEVHQHDAPVADALAGLLAQLPLEEDESFARSDFGGARQ